MKTKVFKTMILFPAVALMSLSSCSNAPTAFTITWKNSDGTVLKVDKDVQKGTLPEYKGEEPKKDRDAQYTYTFSGWEPAIVPATEDATYVARYTTEVNKYTITWKNGDKVLKTESLEYGVTPSYSGETPVKEPDQENIYTFSKWEPAIEKVSKDVTYSATFEAHSKAFDDDYDGIPNGTDPEPFNNVFKNVKFKSMVQMTTDLQIDYRWFLDYDNKVYHNDIAKLGVFLEQNNAEFSDKVEGDIYQRMGCDDIINIDMNENDFKENKDDILGGKLAHHTIVRDNKKTDIVIMQILGTRNTNEWASNFDVGYDNDDYYSKVGTTSKTPDWDKPEDKEYVKGFRCAANRYLSNNKQMNARDYVDAHTKNEGTPIIFIVGHSRGAAAAEILGQYFEKTYTDLNGRKCKTFTYTYASPLVHDTETMSSVESDTVFNIINADDIVPMIPLEQWGFKRIGKDEVVTSVRGLGDKYEKATGVKYENLDGVEKIFITLVGNRNEIYKVDTKRDVNLAYIDKVHTKEEIQYRIEFIKDKIQNTLKLPLNYFEILHDEELKPGENEYSIYIYNCKATLLALATNFLKNIYNFQSWEDIFSFITSVDYVLNDVYLKAVYDFITKTGFITEDYTINPDTVGKPHDLASYLLIVDNYE